jgi:hypothetical protein
VPAQFALGVELGEREKNQIILHKQAVNHSEFSCFIQIHSELWREESLE